MMRHDTNLKIKIQKSKFSKESGFTLIEMLVYILLIAIIMGGTVGVVSQLLRNNENLKTGVTKEEEANFILKKVSWVLNDASSVNFPLPDSSAFLLSVNKNGFAGNPLIIDSNGGVIRIKRGSGPFKQLSNDRLAISDLKFERSWDGVDPETDSITMTFKIDGKDFKLTRKIK